VADLSAQSSNAPQPLKAIIFDVGGVIVRTNLMRPLSAFAENAKLPPQEVWTTIQTDPLWRDWQEGRIVPQAWYEHLACRLRFSLSFEQFRSAWNDVLEPETILSDAFFARLAARYHLALLSNTDPLHVEHMEANYSFPRYFRARVYSCVAGVRKPDPLIYRRAIREVDASPGQILYVDDLQENVEAGCKLGVQGHVFLGVEPLLAGFQCRGMVDE
jgi:HAD superfamily hydrolase (TIGR01493 family)